MTKTYHVKCDNINSTIKVDDLTQNVKYAPNSLKIFIGKPLKSLETWLKQFNPDGYSIEEINGNY